LGRVGTPASEGLASHNQQRERNEDLVSRRLPKAQAQALARGKFFPLAAVEILTLLAQGKTNKQVAAALDVSVPTVEVQGASLMRRLDLRSLSDLIYYTTRNLVVKM
jgi:DNA-binding NarL/FixJ family response regulator